MNGGGVRHNNGTVERRGNARGLVDRVDARATQVRIDRSSRRGNDRYAARIGAEGQDAVSRAGGCARNDRRILVDVDGDVPCQRASRYRIGEPAISVGVDTV